MSKPKQERRGAPRISFRQPLKVKKESGEELDGQARDISSRGLFFFTDARIEKSSQIEIVLMMPPGLLSSAANWVLCQATVVRVENDPVSNQIGVAAVINRCEALPEI